MSVSVAEWLIENRVIYGIGIEGPSIDRGQNKGELRTHVALNERNIYMIENVNGNVAKLPARGARVTVMPLNLVGASGSPVRAFAKVFG